jgi:hypothetical protein
MSAPQHSVPRICAGPRWAALLDTLGEAEDALAEALTDDELANGWSEPLRAAMLESVARNRRELLADPTRDELLEGWTDGEEIDPGAEDPRRDATLGPDLAASNLANAEQVLIETRRLAESIQSPARDADREHGMTDEVRTALRGCLATIERRLEAGEYLDGADVEAWVVLLDSVGFTRHPPATSTQLNRAVDEGGQIAQYPRGRCWEGVCIYDAGLARLANADIG